MPRPKLRPGEPTLRVTLSLASSHVEKLDVLAKLHGGRSGAVRWLLGQQGVTGATAATPPAPVAAFSTDLPMPTLVQPVRAARQAVVGNLKKCSACGSASTQRHGPFALKCLSCGFLG